MAEMKAQARELGRRLIEVEQELDTAFRTGAADETTVARLSAAAGQLSGQLRNVHLQAHLRTQRLLKPAQIAAYARARGYAAEQGLEGGHAH
ncbi:hypothetical protein [Ideonella sp. BN130291]|uniref:hypothetical protein n=1 Tax=Ideonella sp. BN130291 TaxID=3112940 RepID=UPI002E263384|nr:hypothetical protein [Ideonella sp. BN130291]